MDHELADRKFEEGVEAGRKELLNELLVMMAGMQYPTPEKGFSNIGQVEAHLEMGRYNSPPLPPQKKESLLALLQKELPKIWTNELYSEEFLGNKASHRDFQHTLLHVLKAAGRLLEMVEEADHIGLSGLITRFKTKEVEKYVADIVISAVRLAIKSPNGEFDIEAAILGRIEKKMGVKLSP